MKDATLSHARRRWWAAIFFAVALLSASLASADAPPLLPIQGTLHTADGAFVEGPVNVTFTLYADSTGTTSIWTDTQSVVFTGGHFTAYLGSGAALNMVIFRDYSVVYVGVTIQGDTEMPLFPLATSPYGAWSDYCGESETLGGMSADALQASILTEAESRFSPQGHRHTWQELDGIPADLADGDADTHLSEAEVDAFVANNGYRTTDNDTHLTEAEVDAYVANNGYITGRLVTLYRLHSICGEGVTTSATCNSPACGTNTSGDPIYRECDGACNTWTGSTTPRACTNTPVGRLIGL